MNKFFRNKVVNLLFIGFLIFGMLHCVTYKIKFDELKYPASTSAYLYDSNVKKIVTGKDLKQISAFSY